MDIKDWMAPMVTLAIGASTIFISYKNYQSQTQAKPSELARLELWSKLLAEAGIDIGDLPPEDELTAEQREILENYRVFLKRASLESKLRKVGIENNRLFNLLMKRAHSPVKPTPIGFGDSIIYYRLILWLFAFIWIPIATIFLGIPVLISFGAYLYRMFITRSADNYVDYSIPVGSSLSLLGFSPLAGSGTYKTRFVRRLSPITCISISGTPTAPSEAAAIPCRRTPSG